MLLIIISASNYLIVTDIDPLEFTYALIKIEGDIQLIAFTR